MKFLFVLLSSLVLITPLSFAGDSQYDLTGRWGVGVGLGGSTIAGPKAFTEGATELDGGFVGSLWARYHYNKRFGVEAAYTNLAFNFAQSSSAFNNLDPKVSLFMLNAAYRAWPEERLHMLVQVGAGLEHANDFNVVGDSSFNKLAVSGRLGGEFMVSPDLMLALHLDYYALRMQNTAASSLNVWAPMLGITYYFSGKKAAAIAVGDDDGDGINDANDKCPKTPAGTRVGADGCPLKVTAGDSDGDGVPDAVDKCPGTPAGQQVNEYGCAKSDKFEVTLDVRFATGSTKVDPKYTADLEKFANFMLKYADTHAEIEGHTDNTGSEKLNYSISQKRAAAVRAFLISKYKVPAKRLTAKGYGPSQPIADNSKQEGRDKNRRVVAHVTTNASN